jgi:hypothetical protein
MYWKTTIFALGLTLGLAAPQAFKSVQAGQSGRIQDDDARATRERNRQTAERRLARNVETLRQLQGCWLLSEFRSPTLLQEGRQEIAYLMVAEEFMALEIHMGYFDEKGDEEEAYLQSGIYRINFNTYGDMITKLLIGTLDVGVGKAVPRQPGLTSVFEVELGEGRLTMTAEDTTRFIWTKVKTGALTNRLYEELDWLARDSADAKPVEAGNKSE